MQKPPYGSPCNGCGDCCRYTLCPLGNMMFMQERGPCPALLTDGNGCGLMVAPERWAPIKAALHGSAQLGRAAAVLMGSGLGCDYESKADVATSAIRQRMIEKAKRVDRGSILRARRMWGI